MRPPLTAFSKRLARLTQLSHMVGHEDRLATPDELSGGAERAGGGGVHPDRADAAGRADPRAGRCLRLRGGAYPGAALQRLGEEAICPAQEEAPEEGGLGGL